MVKFLTAEAALRAAVVRRFAETGPDGLPQRCPRCPAHKVVFADERAVRGAIDMLRTVDGEDRYPHPCYDGGQPGVVIWHYTRKAPAKSKEDHDAP